MELRFRDIGFEDVRSVLATGKFIHVGEAPGGEALLGESEPIVANLPTPPLAFTCAFFRVQIFFNTLH
jgi:hypothetical protein